MGLGNQAVSRQNEDLSFESFRFQRRRQIHAGEARTQQQDTALCRQAIQCIF